LLTQVNKWVTRVVVTILTPLILLAVHARLDRAKAREDHQEFVILWREIWTDEAPND
jgi:hypothetical protein